MDMSLEARIAKLEARAELQDLVGTYAHWVLAGEGDRIVRELWADCPEASVEFGASGPYIGYEHMACFFEKDRLPGRFVLLYPSAPVIRVASDGMSARGIWLGIGTATDSGELNPSFEPGADPEREALFTSETEDGKRYTAEWMFEKLAFDFVREDGVWKILRLHVYDIARCPFDRDWVRFAEERFRTDGQRLDALFKSNRPDGPPENMASEPTAYHWQYMTGSVTEPVPAMPEPFDSLDGLPPL